MSPSYYVRAIRGAGAHAEWRPLLGPFQTYRAAHMMVRPVQLACERARIYKGCTFGVWRADAKRYGPGSLPLERLNLEDVINASRDPLQFVQSTE